MPNMQNGGSQNWTNSIRVAGCLPFVISFWFSCTQGTKIGSWIFFCNIDVVGNLWKWMETDVRVYRYDSENVNFECEVKFEFMIQLIEKKRIYMENR